MKVFMSAAVSTSRISIFASSICLLPRDSGTRKVGILTCISRIRLSIAENFLMLKFLRVS